jgi:hypothetical protein
MGKKRGEARLPVSWLIVVVWTLAMSCWLTLLRTISMPLASDA